MELITNFCFKVTTFEPKTPGSHIKYQKTWILA